MASTYSGVIVTPADVIKFEEFRFRDSCYLTYNGISGTQSGTFGVTKEFDGIWNITHTGTIYHIDTTLGDITILFPEVTEQNLGETIVVTKPSTSKNTKNITLSSISSQNIGPNLTYVFDSPGDTVAFVATQYGSAGALNYRWRQVWNNIESAGIVEVNRLTGFTSIKSAIDSISDASAIKPYEVIIKPGIYVEDNPIDVNPYIVIRGAARDSVIIKPLNENENLFKLNQGTELKELTFKDVSGAAVDISEPSSDCFLIMQDLNFVDCYTWIQSINPTYHVTIDSHTIDGEGICNTAVKLVAVSGISQSIDGIIHNIEYYPVSGKDAGTFISINGELVSMTFNSVDIEGEDGATVDCGIRLYDGSKLFSNGVDFSNLAVGISGDNLGAGPFIQLINFNTYNCTTDYVLNHPQTTGFIGGYFSENHSVSSTYLSEMRYASEIGGGLHIVGDIHQRPNHDIPDVNLSELIRQGAALGLISGGNITEYSALSVGISGGNGFTTDGLGNIVPVAWSNGIIELPDNSSSYITYEYGTGLGSQVSIPIYSESIVLGQVITVNGAIDHIVTVPVVVANVINGVENVLREGLGPVYSRGSTIATSSDLSLSATQGLYYYGTEAFELTGGNPITWESYYKQVGGNWTEVEDVTALDTGYYNPSTGNLSAVDSSYFVKHALYTIGRDDLEEYVLVYGQTQHSTLKAALSSDIPTEPNFFTNLYVPLASIITQQGSTDVTIEDIRPIFGRISNSTSTGGGGGVSVHAELQGLNADDHLQYLLVAGSRAMNGDLDMGSNDITNVSTVDGVDVSTHAARHLPGGSDALTVAAPVSISTANQIGIQPSFSRSDHIHAHGSQSASSNHALVTNTTHGFAASSDKIKWDTAYVHLTGDAMTGQLSLSTDSSVAPLHIEQITTPASLNAGDIWVENEGLFVYTPDNYINQLNRATSTVGAINKVSITQTSISSISADTIEAYLFSLSGWTGDYKRYTIPAITALDLTNNSINYLVINYNSGSPVYQITTNPATINNSNVCIAASMSREDEIMHWIPVDWGLATAARENNKGINVQRFTRISGLVLSESAGNTIEISSGVVYYGVTNFTKAAAASTSNNAYVYYKTDATTWTKALTSTYINDRYQTASNGLSSVDSSHYTINWVYRFIDGENTAKIAYTLGTSSYTLAEALAADVPIPPTVINRMAILVGRIIVKGGAATAISIDSAFTQTFAGSNVINHNDLDNVQGGSVNDYYHLTQTELNNVLSTYTTVSANSATTWNYQGTDLKALSAEWVGGNNAYTTVNANSANWNAGYTYSSTSSATNNLVNTKVQTASASWDSVYTTTNANSASWGGGTYQQASVNTYTVTNTEADVTSVTITVGQTGTYLINLTCSATSASNSSTGFIILNINGSNVSLTNRVYARGNQTVTCTLASSYIAALTAGQVVKARAQYTAGALTLNNVILNIVKI